MRWWGKRESGILIEIAVISATIILGKLSPLSLY
jgi:hypothetical protein